MHVTLRGSLVVEEPEPGVRRRVTDSERREQAAARAAAHLERYFEGRPDPDELRKAMADLEEAVELAG